MNGENPRDRQLAAAAIVVGWAVLLGIFAAVGAIVFLCGPVR